MKYVLAATVTIVVIGFASYKKHMNHPQIVPQSVAFAETQNSDDSQFENDLQDPPLIMDPQITQDPYNDETIVAEHEAVCSYCSEKLFFKDRRFGSYHRVNDRHDGEHCHFHRCTKCGDEFVCGFESTIDPHLVDRIELGFKSRSCD